MAEESGLIIPLGQWVLRQACHDVRHWQESYPSDPPLLLSINLSARQFAHPELPEDVHRALAESGLPAGSLVLEIPEAVLMQEPAQAQARFERLRRLGVLLAIDDFGFGLSCVNALQGFAADLVKIDKGFIDHIALGGASSKLALRIIEQARRLSLQTVAEGVEEAGQLAEVVAAGCDLAQGFSLARPLDPTDLEALLRTARPEPELYQQPSTAAFRASA
jgi:EAL domain-containing protein (putative c-di-GMP-specific phosphodiesterase class I)